MTLKEELEILRGEPIQVFTGDPKDIPCIETSDPEKLCKHPVVSVHMITYNHEPYIRQAIEGVMMQQTDFEFELVIGEDCSTDRTREICFEYQKKYPDKIRVLWWHKNLYRNLHPAGGNGRRTTAHCRGEFIAFCEGDDYWTDPMKLQRQVEAMRKHPNVGLCFALADVCNIKTGEVVFGTPRSSDNVLMPGSVFNALKFTDNLVGIESRIEDCQIRTLTAMVRAEVLGEASRKYPNLFGMRLMVGDYMTWSAVASLSDLMFLPDRVGVYRIHPGGVTSLSGLLVARDCLIIAVWFLRSIYPESRMSVEVAMGLRDVLLHKLRRDRSAMNILFCVRWMLAARRFSIKIDGTYIARVISALCGMHLGFVASWGRVVMQKLRRYVLGI